MDMANRLNELAAMMAIVFELPHRDPRQPSPWDMTLNRYRYFLDSVIEEHIRDGLRKANKGLEAVPEQFRNIMKQKIIWTRMEAHAILKRRGLHGQRISEVAAIEEHILKAVNMFASLSEDTRARVSQVGQCETSDSFSLLHLS